MTAAVQVIHGLHGQRIVKSSFVFLFAAQAQIQFIRARIMFS